MGSIIRFFVTNRHFTLIATISFLLFGVLSVLSMRVQLNPDIQFPTLKLTISYPQANQDTLKRTVIDPLIPLLRENDRILSSQFEIQDQYVEGIFTFSVNDDLDKQFWSFNQKLQKISQQLPDQVQFSLHKEQLSQVIDPFVIAIKGGEGKASYEQALILKQQLLLVPDVSGVSLLGNTSSLWIELDSLAVLRNQLSYSQIFSQIKARSTDMIQGSTTIGDLIIPVSFKTMINSEKELKEIVFYPPQGNSVQLKDIATFKSKKDEPLRLSTLDGEDTLLLAIQLRDKADISQVSKAINRVLVAYENSVILYDESVEISYHLRQLIINLVQGLLILFVVLFLLLGFRSGLLISLLLPATVLFAIGFLNILGQPLQQVSIAGLIISLGLLIDNAIVVTESCLHSESNSSTKEAHYIQQIIQQTAIVSKPLVFSTVTTILAFLPIYFLKTEAGLFLKSVSLTIAVTLFASILLALTIIPFFLSFQRKSRDKEPWGHRVLVRLRDHYYIPFINRYIYSKRLVLCILVGGIIAGGLMITQLPFQLFPSSEDQYGYVTLRRYVGESDALFKTRVDAVIQKINQTVPTQFIVQTVGMGFPRINYSMTSYTHDPDIAQLFFKIKAHRSKKHEVINQLEIVLLALPFSDSISIQEFMFNQSEAFPLTIQVSGHSLLALEQSVSEIQQWANNRSQVLGVLSSNEEHHLGIAYQLDQDKLIANGLSEEDLRLAIQFAVTGKYVMSLYDRFQQRVPVMMSIQKSEHQIAQDLLNLIIVVNDKGNSFLLSELVSFNLNAYPKSQRIKNELLTVELTLQLQPNTNHKDLIVALTQKSIELEQVYPVQLTVHSSEKKLSDNFVVFTRVSCFFIVLIFSLLVVIFQSFKLPIIIFTVLPVSFMGGLLGLMVMGQSLSLFAYLGFVSLAGIVINDSILLIDAFEKLKKREGSTVTTQLISAAQSRFIPVSTTSITTVLGVLPLVLVSSLFQPLAVVLMGGILVSTVVILITVPILVYWFES
jgi:multidrug efflux pump subunit AcrB